MAINDNSVPAPPIFRSPDSNPAFQPNQNPANAQPFMPPGFVNSSYGGTVNPWQTGNELFRSEMGVDWLRTNDPLRGFKW